MSRIKKILAREILDSRAIPTIQGVLYTDTGQVVKCEISSGRSVSKYELKELRDGDTKRYYGMGVTRAVSYINNLIAPKLVGVEIQRISEIDRWLIEADGTKDRSRIGSNTIMTVSQLLIKAHALTNNIQVYEIINKVYTNLFSEKIALESLPAPIINVINGGLHGSNTLDFQEFHLIPSTSFSFPLALEKSILIFNEVKNVLDRKNVGTFLSDQGGYTPRVPRNIDALEVLREAIAHHRMRLGVEVFIGLDCAASYYFSDKRYTIKDSPESLTSDAYIDFLSELSKKYSILVLEDPIEQDDFSSWKNLAKKVGDSTYLAGDDLISGSSKRLKKALDAQSCNSVVLKFNQFSTITELLSAVKTLRDAKVKIIISQRFGETSDTLLADLAYGIQADFVKFGSPNRGERVVKYNRMLEISDTLQTTKSPSK